MRMLVIWVAFLAASLGAKENSHVSLRVLLRNTCLITMQHTAQNCKHNCSCVLALLIYLESVRQ